LLCSGVAVFVPSVDPGSRFAPRLLAAAGFAAAAVPVADGRWAVNEVMGLLRERREGRAA
jgi:hypothetical protein